MEKPELVFDIGCEGGQSSIFRVKNEKDEWEYFVSGGGMYLDGNDRESWGYGSNPPVPTFLEALHSTASDGFWIFFHVLSIHPEYRKTVWIELQKIVEHLSAESLEHWKHEKDRWRQFCLEGT